MAKFNIVMKHSIDGDRIKQIEAEPIMIAGFKCFIHKEKEYDIVTGKMVINISEFETGMLCGTGCSNKLDSIKSVKERLTKYPHKVEEGKQLLIKDGFKLPINK